MANLPRPGQLLAGCISNGVLQATVGATFKLFVACGFVGWLLHSGRISDDTAPVLSKVAFNLMLPCMLFSKVAATLATDFKWSYFVVPVLGLLQLGVGAVGGEVANRLLDGSYGRKLGWHPMNPPQSAKAIAMSTASASGVPNAAPALLPRPNALPPGTKELVTTCCTFGNSFTLPLVFMMSLLPHQAFDRATGYTALFLMAWSPFLYSYGYQLFNSAAPPAAADQQGPLQSFDEADMRTAQMALLASPDQGEATSAHGSLQVKLMLRRKLSAIRRQVEKVVNPPLVGIVAGVIVGVSPLGPPLFCPVPVAEAAAARLPMELSICLGVLKLGVEMLALLAGGTLALQTIVLAASLFQKIPQREPQPQQPMLALPDGQGSLTSNWMRPGAARQPVKGTQTDQAWTKGRSTAQLDLPPPKAAGPAAAQDRSGVNLMRILLPETSLEWKVVVCVALVRFLLVPAVSLLAVDYSVRWGLLPTDPVCWLALLVQAAMPSAQNLTLLANLQKSTQFLAPQLAKLLLRLYTMSPIPVTFWITIFVSRLPLPLSQL